MSKSIYDSLNKGCLEERGTKIRYRLNSNSSLGFDIPKERIARKNELKKIFKITDTKFDKKYEEASTGSGRPYKDFDALYSSALCALLSFYNINDLVIDGISYDKAYFEVQNTAIERKKPSNMDVVLVSKNNKTILFLECKFKEYISNGAENVSTDYLNCCELSNSLYDIVRKNGLGTIKEVDGKDQFQFYTKKAYSQGTKQVISHLVGINSFIHRDKNYFESFSFYGEDDERKKLYEMDFEHVKFREVLFELKGYEKTLKDYMELSEEIRVLFNESGLIKDIEYEPSLKYQDIFAGKNIDNVGEIIARFYCYR